MKLHVIQGFIQNIFLVEYQDKCMLLDGCSRADFKAIKCFFDEELKRPLSNLKVVLVTHMHPDHAGCAHYLRSQTGCKIISAETTKQWYAGIGGRFAHIVDIGLAFWVANKLKRPKKNIWYSPHLAPDITLNNGDLIPGFEDWQVIETPGHTDRDLSFMHLPTKRIYVADLIVRVKKRYSPPFPVHFPSLYKESVKRVAQLNPRTVLMAHAPEAHINSDEFNEIIRKAPASPETNAKALKQLLKKRFLGNKHSLRE